MGYIHPLEDQIFDEQKHLMISGSLLKPSKCTSFSGLSFKSVPWFLGTLGRFASLDEAGRRVVYASMGTVPCQMRR